jgi:hypothetical protein
MIARLVKANKSAKASRHGSDAMGDRSG